MKSNGKSYCVIIPTYNNEKTLLDVVKRTLSKCPDIIIIDDGSTDSTPKILESIKEQVDIITYQPNRGKGYALKQGLSHARKKGYDYAISIDSDGQHRPEEIDRFTKRADRHGDERILIVGSRNLRAEGMPKGNTFANKFSNFWFTMQTGQHLEDTQTGYRLYQLNALPKMGLITNRYESELELLVFSAWRGVHIMSEDITVYYPPKGQRVTHFRPYRDFARIFILNTLLCVAAIVYGYPSKLIHHIINHHNP